MILPVILGVLYVSGYVALALLGAYGAKQRRYALMCAGMFGWVLWNMAWFTAAALIR